MLADRMRPRQFQDVIGQNLTELATALRREEPPQAYLLFGPSGTGKTTTAYLIAEFFNCPNGSCGQCEICESVYNQWNTDIRFINAKLDGGIDSIRTIVDDCHYRPMSLRKKVYIFDEAHQLTKDALDGLLSILENIPPHIIFIFTTTDPSKLRQTITSRLFSVGFVAIGYTEIASHLIGINRIAGLGVDSNNIQRIATAADGNLRKAINALDGGGAGLSTEEEKPVYFYSVFLANKWDDVAKFIFENSYEPMQVLSYMLSALKGHLNHPFSRTVYIKLCTMPFQTNTPSIMRHQLYGAILSCLHYPTANAPTSTNPTPAKSGLRPK